MNKQKWYYPVWFNADVVKSAAQTFLSLPATRPEDLSESWSVSLGSETWQYDSADEFYADYRKNPRAASIFLRRSSQLEFQLQIVRPSQVRVLVTAPTRAQIESVFACFDSAENASTVPEERAPAPTIFIGHGRNGVWRDLKDHLHEQHDYEVTAYETGARAGHAIRDILEAMLSKSAFALLVLTAEDEGADGAIRARQNVVHELGLFQGRLGFARAIVLLEEGTDEFSNILGIHQIRFSPGKIRETFGDVLATLRREFGSPAG